MRTSIPTLRLLVAPPQLWADQGLAPDLVFANGGNHYNQREMQPEVGIHFFGATLKRLGPSFRAWLANPCLNPTPRRLEPSSGRGWLTRA